mmetsp:Transcript_33730/g.34358  ORF Transcript_33730/g.34358 Transcript_33730/m.34358 type:complete len:115 (+) Transcript_33730:173-517(+)
MSWFGGGSNKIDDDKPISSFTDQFDTSGPSDFGSRQTSQPSFGGGASSFQNEMMAEQQKALVQAVMFKLTDTAFDMCISKPSSSLSSSEKNCIANTVGKYLDTSEFIVRRMSGK